MSPFAHFNPVESTCGGIEFKPRTGTSFETVGSRDRTRTSDILHSTCPHLRVCVWSGRHRPESILGYVFYGIACRVQ